MKPGSSTLFVLVRKSTPDKVLDEVKGTGGKVLRTSLSHDDEAKLQAALSAQKSVSKSRATEPVKSVAQSFVMRARGVEQTDLAPLHRASRRESSGWIDALQIRAGLAVAPSVRVANSATADGFRRGLHASYVRRARLMNRDNA